MKSTLMFGLIGTLSVVLMNFDMVLQVQSLAQAEPTAYKDDQRGLKDTEKFMDDHKGSSDKEFRRDFKKFDNDHKGNKGPQFRSMMGQMNGAMGSGMNLQQMWELFKALLKMAWESLKGSIGSGGGGMLEKGKGLIEKGKQKLGAAREKVRSRLGGGAGR